MYGSEAYKEGYNAYCNDLTIVDNPYFSDMQEWEDWKNGWYDAAWDD